MYINAWLDCTNPFISVHNKFDDDVLAHFNTKKVNQLIKDGDITIAELQSSDLSIQMDVITDLIAIQSGEKIKKQIKSMGLSITKRKPKLPQAHPPKLGSQFSQQREIYAGNLLSAPALKVI